MIDSEDYNQIDYRDPFKLVEKFSRLMKNKSSESIMKLNHFADVLVVKKLKICTTKQL